jgi:hypothetical protein
VAIGLQLLAEWIGKTDEPAHGQAHGQIPALDKDVLKGRVWIARTDDQPLSLKDRRSSLQTA